MNSMTTTIGHHPTTENPPSAGAETPVPDSAAVTDQNGPTRAEFQVLERRIEQRANRRDAWTMFTMVFAAIAVLFGIIAIGLGTRAIDDSKRNVSAASASTPRVSAPTPAVSPVTVTLSEMRVQPSSTTIAAGMVTLKITNTGMVQHELLVFRSDLAPADYPMKDGDINEDGPGITKVSDGDNLNPGTSQTRVVDFTTPGTYMLMCNLPGHFKMGMYSVVTVK